MRMQKERIQREQKPNRERNMKHVRKNGQWLRLLAFLFCCILFLWLGVRVFQEKRYAFISLGLTILACLFLVSGFDKKRTHVRRLVLIAVMTALSVLGRFVFAALPGFRPMTAMIVLTGMYLGYEAGFLCGACTAVLSNFYFGQGPWTPFQMFSFGMLGLLAGVFSGPLKRSRIVLVLYGIFAGVAYSLMMDVWSVLWAYDGFSVAAYNAALITALPYTLSYALSNVLFLLLIRKPFGIKLNRMLIKYGI